MSVIVPVHNCRDTLGRALGSAFAQTLPSEQVEVIAVDDGSTDGGGELLDELARAHARLTVVHQPPSGGPGAPRNRGLELASGTFVFFLDADDALGPEALERMTAMAERNGTDIVLGKQVGTGGRRTPQVFGETIERTHVLEHGSDLFWRMSMAALQLFRRSLIEDAGLRFAEGVLSHEDQLFTAGAHLRARAVSILADYDCYYWAARESGTSSTQIGGARAADVYAIIAEAMEETARYAEPGEIRDQLHRRYLDQEVFGRLQRLYLDAPDDEREITYTRCRELLKKWLTPGLLQELVPLRRVIAHCVLHDLAGELETVLRFHTASGRPRVHLEDGRAYLEYPFFRAPSTPIPDECYESRAPVRVRHHLTELTWADDSLRISGDVLLHDVDRGRPVLHLVLADGAGSHQRIRCEAHPPNRTDEGLAASYTTSFFPAPGSWPDGRWTVHLETTLAGHALTTPVVKPRGFTMPRAAVVDADGRWRVVRPLSPGAREPLTLEVGGALKATDFRDVKVGWGPKKRMWVRAEAPPILGNGPAMSVLLHLAGDSRVIRAALEAVPDDPSRRYADISLGDARRGCWRVRFAIDGVGEPVPVRLASGSGVPGPATASLVPPRRLRVRLDRKTLIVHVTAPLAFHARRIRAWMAPGVDPGKHRLSPAPLPS
ncbi:glycosyltransferase [Actinomadura sp. KC06]|uniref:glycosyltransferase n=1 Tax=Actinomadura sp. KC06 TaxID=2530369 RepID=UPI0014045351|nr:glycosyltransferase [Actinomadura sp. KC06]